MLEKRVIGLEDPPFEIPDEDPDDVGIDQAPDLRFALLKIAVQTGIFQRDRRLRGEQLQHRDPGRREDAGGQVVFQVEHADELGLVQQRQAENGAGAMLSDIGIGRKGVLGCGIVEDHALPRAQDIMEDRIRQRGSGHGLVAQTHDDRVATGRGFRLDPLLRAACKDQQAALRPRLLDRGAHERVEQLFQDDLARHGLRHFHHGGEVQMLDRRPDRAGRTRAAFVLPQLRIELIELPHLARRRPNADSRSGRPADHTGNLLEAARRVEAGGQFVSERLVVKKPLARAERMACS